MVFLPTPAFSEIPCPSASPDARAGLRAFYEVVDTMDVDARVAFTLRYVDGMELTEVAEACDVSLATVKRRLKNAKDDFYRRGRGHPELETWFEQGNRWQTEDSPRGGERLRTCRLLP